MAKNCSLPYLYRTCPLDRVCNNIGVRKPNLYSAIEYISEKDPYFTQQNTRLKMVFDKFNKELEDYINRTLENGSELWNIAKDERERAQRERKANKERKEKQREMYDAENNAKDADTDETLEKKRSSKKRKNNPNDDLNNDLNDDLTAQIAKMEELLSLEKKDNENLRRQQQQQQADDKLTATTATSSASQLSALQNVPIKIIDISGKEFKYTMTTDPKTGQPMILLESD